MPSDPAVNILLVDDHPGNLVALEALLGDLGQNLVKATSGMDALKCLLQDDFDLVLLDVQMPGIDGYETARLIREREKSRDTPIVFITAINKSDEHASRGYAVGAIDYIRKPISGNHLKAKVAALVDIAQRSRQQQAEIAEQRQTAEALRHAQADLQAAVAERTAALEAETAQRRRAEARNRRLVESNIIGVMVGDFAGGIIEANQAFLEMVGYSRADLADGRLGWRELTPPEHLPRDEEAIAALRREGVCAPYEKAFIRKDGKRVPVLLGCATVDWPGEETVCFVADLTQQKSLEEALRVRAQHLAHVSRLKDEYLAMLGHELRNPLNAVSNALHVIGRSRRDSPAYKRALDAALRQVQHQIRMVDDLLDVSRISRGRLDLQSEPFDLAATVRHTAEDFRAGLEEAGISLEVTIPRRPIPVLGDATRVAQVIGNLLDNAGKYTPREGQVQLTVRTVAKTREAVVSVRDTGIGMDADLLPHLFEPFTQAERSLDRSEGGLGLGLALVRGLVEAHGGRVEAHSAGAGLGAEFTLVFPLADEPRPLPRKTVPQHKPGSRHILVVEDNQDGAETLRDLLELAGFQVELAFTGPEGIAAARRLQPDVVLCDIGLPGTDGYQVAAALRKHPATRSCLLIAITGYGGSEDRRRTAEAGFDHHLVKPVDPAALQTLIGDSA